MTQSAENIQTIEEQVIACRLCPRLVTYREEVARVKRRALIATRFTGENQFPALVTLLPAC
jgi:uracil-DNA glycosylase